MACYRPMLRIEDKTKPYTNMKGKTSYKAKLAALYDGKNDLIRDAKEFETDYPLWKYKYDIIPCGKCIGCRLEYSREWANRGYLESKLYEHNYFITLTYDEKYKYTPEYVELNNNRIYRDNEPKRNEKYKSETITYTDPDPDHRPDRQEEATGTWKGILIKRDLQLFFKRLRKEIAEKYNHTGIRFMACGEYGDEGSRPHYHAIIFNCPLPAETFYEPRIINHEIYYRNTIIEKAWSKRTGKNSEREQFGICNICPATWNNIAYTARYITKKTKGAGSIESYAAKGQIPEYLVTSRMPGIGKPYYDLHKDEIYRTDSVIIKNKEGVITTKPPKYFDKLYELEEPEKMAKIRRKRKRDQEAAERVKDEKTSLTRMEQKAIEERTKEMQSKKLYRDMAEKWSKAAK